MLKSIKLKNFKKHESLDLEFDAGLTALRGGNENGKSTILHAIAYALFGSKALNTTLEDTVSWGKPVNSLMVNLTLQIEGVEYYVSRAKSGAEINYDGGKVTGQNECSAFISRLFGTDPERIMRLILANQGNIRGALEQGPKATTELIEKLSNFDILDQVINLIQDNLLLGAPASLEQRVAAADEQVAKLEAALAPPDVEASAREVELLTTDITNTKFHLTETLLPALQKAREDHQQGEKLHAQIEQLRAQIEQADKDIGELFSSAATARAQSSIQPEQEVIDSLKKQVEEAASAGSRLAVYQELDRLNKTYPEAFWEGDLLNLRAEIADIESWVAHATTTITDLKSDIKVLEAQKVTGSVCGFCNQDTSQFPEVAAKNAGIEEQVRAKTKEISGLEGELLERKHDLAELKAVLKSAEPFDRFIRNNAQHVTVDENFVPAKITWNGAAPTATVDITGLKGELAKLEQQKRDAAIATGKLQGLTERLIEMRKKRDGLNTSLWELGVAPDMVPLQEAMDQADAVYVEHQNRIYDQEAQLKAIQSEIDKQQALYKQAQAQVEAAKAEQERALKDLKTLRFNNNLLKQVKAARPVIADRLWSVVLNAVSVFFSQMRGEKSVVTKEKDGFRVNGQTIDGLSGSTLDALGLAIRAALTKTFLPHLGMLLLDEPFAAMDDQRSAATLGFISSLGFAQVLLVTHEESSEAVADNLIAV